MISNKSRNWEKIIYLFDMTELSLSTETLCHNKVSVQNNKVGEDLDILYLKRTGTFHEKKSNRSYLACSFSTRMQCSVKPGKFYM